MTEFMDQVNAIRETEVSNYYNAAWAELQDKIKATPMTTTFEIYAGCVSEEVAREIARRLVLNGTEATAKPYGLIFAGWYLEVTIALPASLGAVEKTEEHITTAE